MDASNWTQNLDWNELTLAQMEMLKPSTSHAPIAPPEPTDEEVDAWDLFPGRDTTPAYRVLIEFGRAARAIINTICRRPSGWDSALERELHMGIVGWLATDCINPIVLAMAMRRVGLGSLRIQPDKKRAIRGSNDPGNLIASTFERLRNKQPVYGKNLIKGLSAKHKVPVDAQKAFVRALRKLAQVQEDLGFGRVDQTQDITADLKTQAKARQDVYDAFERSLPLIIEGMPPELKDVAAEGARRAQAAIACGTFSAWCHCPAPEHAHKHIMTTLLRCGSPYCSWCLEHVLQAKTRACLTQVMDLQSNKMLGDAVVVRVTGKENWTPAQAKRAFRVFMRCALLGSNLLDGGCVALRDPAGLTIFYPEPRLIAARQAVDLILSRSDELGIAAAVIKQSEDQIRLRREAIKEHVDAKLELRRNLARELEDTSTWAETGDLPAVPIDPVIRIGRDPWYKKCDVIYQNKESARHLLPWPSKTSVREQLSADAWASRGYAEVPDMACPEPDPERPSEACSLPLRHGCSEATTGLELIRGREFPIGIRKAVRLRSERTGAWCPAPSERQARAARKRYRRERALDPPE